MSPRPASAPSDATALLDDFEWPPKADNVSVHEIETDPWRAIDDDATDGVDEATDATLEPEPPAGPPPSVPSRKR